MYKYNIITAFYHRGSEDWVPSMCVSNNIVLQYLAIIDFFVLDPSLLQNESDKLASTGQGPVVQGVRTTRHSTCKITTPMI